MSLALPDKYVRKAIFTALSGLNVEGNDILTYDTNTTGSNPLYYILMTTQTNNELNGSKCGRRWFSSILLDIVTRYDGSGNTGSRLLADNIAEAARVLIKNLDLEVGSGLKITQRTLNFPNDISTKTDNTNIFRKFIRLELEIDKL
tara:strand:- start:2800 stop:3237 length:438 start_codon:yes stop_codon:yes gene_type:complete